MTQYVLKRALYLIPTLLLVALVAFALLHITPGDPAQMILGVGATEQQVETLRQELGLHLPVHVQFWRFLTDLVSGDMGKSYYHEQPVLSLFFQRFPATVEMSLAALLIAILVATPLGVIAAVYRYSAIDYASIVLSLSGVSIPVFWLGIMLMYIFAVQLGWLPVTGRGTPLFSLSWLRHLVLPSVTLSTIILASNTRLLRASMLEVLRNDYIRTARAKGLRERVVVYRHALKNALIPVVTNLGLQLGLLLGGSFLTETIFAWPGVGRLTVNAVFRRDFPLIQGIMILLAVVFVGANLLVDILYAALDPRIRYD